MLYDNHVCAFVFIMFSLHAVILSFVLVGAFKECPLVWVSFFFFNNLVDILTRVVCECGL